MTERLSGVLVTFEKDIRKDDAKDVIIKALLDLRDTRRLLEKTAWLRSLKR